MTDEPHDLPTDGMGLLGLPVMMTDDEYNKYDYYERRWYEELIRLNLVEAFSRIKQLEEEVKRLSAIIADGAR